MTTIARATTHDPRAVLSLLWIFLLLNFIYCDVIGLHDGLLLADLIDGHAGPIAVSPLFLLLSSFLMEIPIAMVLVARFARRKANRVANIVAAAFMVTVQSASLFAGAPSPSYAFFSAIEIACVVFIAVYAVRWKRPIAD